MPEKLAQPGVYIEEIPSGVHTITGVATSITAFVGRAARGRTDAPVTILGFDGFEREFGGLWEGSRLGFAVRDFFLNGGGQAVICRIYQPPAGGSGTAGLAFGQGDRAVKLVAVSPGAWGNGLRARVDLTGAPAGELFNLVVADTGTGATERHAGVSLYADHPRCVRNVLERDSALVRWGAEPLTAVPGTPRVRPVPAAAPAEAGATPDWQDPAGVADAAATVAAAALKEAVNGSAVDGAAAQTAHSAVAAAGQAKEEADRARQDADTALAAAKQEKQRTEAGLSTAASALTAAQQASPVDLQKVKEAEKAQAEAKAADDAAEAAVTGVTDIRTKAVTWVGDAAARVTEATAAAATADGKAVEAEKAAEDRQTDLRTARDQATAAAGQLGGDDGVVPGTDAVRGQYERLLDQADLFNLLCIPPYRPDGSDVEPVLFDLAAAYCRKRRAVLLVDPPSAWTTADAAVTGFRAAADQLGGRGPNAAVYFPRLSRPNPFRGGATEPFVPCGAVAGVLARTDAVRGVWKAGAGLEAGLVGVPDLAVRLSDGENGLLNPLGVNCLRSFPVAGRVVWGARTLAGADVLASEWKYLPVRRLALFIEESLFRGTQWVVFEPNGEALWAQVRLNVGSFMQELFRQGALQGSSPREAYFVKCDAETTTQADRDLGVVNIRVGFAPLKPAEFVVVQVQQLSEQLPS
ncbi:phage tail sheath C-terminal domain-containing protein [Streptomyces sp. CB01881]|uniref:phage tail sheath family protein n=1 Tax=Streptomyces sp. CB01881 TaxID=2078691 RepID=UPI000CDC9E21|nr:phage tail sheath C-terminal domain-containing protein [Streptomyces sp. CB01881]AUY53141.1 phage tail protein [Streptomyces sp. CB01881]TYC69296.1 phage tail sheath family protein [Streptomyces sp. CB01881]